MESSKSKSKAKSNLLSTDEILAAIVELRANNKQTPRFSDLEEEDFVLEYQIKGYSSEGELFSIKGSSSMPQVLSQDMMPEARTNFEGTLATSIVRPVINAFNRILNSMVKKSSTPSSSFSDMEELALENKVEESEKIPSERGEI